VAAPVVVWERTTRRVLTLSDVTAIKLNDVAALRAAGIDPREVAQAFAGAMFDQLFGAGFFHADPHPGNVFVTPHTPGAEGPAWTLTFIDFGMMGQVPAGLRDGLRKIVIAVAARDGKGLVDGIQRIGVLLPAPTRASSSGRSRPSSPASAGWRSENCRTSIRASSALRGRLRRGHAVAARTAAGELPADHASRFAHLRSVQRPRPCVQRVRRSIPMLSSCCAKKVAMS
jgi:hypothetical protein